MSSSAAAKLLEEALSEEFQRSLSLIEHSNFEHIKLTLWNLPELNLITNDNRAQVRCISLSLQLEGASPFDKEYARTADDCIITKGIHDLFWMLSSWVPQGQLNLEIYIHSPNQESLNPPTDQVILGFGRRQVFFDEAYERHWWQTLPEAPAVTSLVLKVQFDRAWKPTTLDNLISRLPNLEDFRYDNVPEDDHFAADGILIHHDPSFSGKRWSRALAYYNRIREQYLFIPTHLKFAREFDPLRRPTADD
ncbi:hypothetical protein NPX13_g8115 [Xylaria arbuscula]|uniref:Uncharacterized protein n=1 Tax=Xylaria arbuscula TaxID=114810 RepID=A0A9W8N905_9PEZI|nr:hypothetical protein NPX13_g8115 [Xylaria arbuscula]